MIKQSDQLEAQYLPKPQELRNMSKRVTYIERKHSSKIAKRKEEALKTVFIPLSEGSLSLILVNASRANHRRVTRGHSR